MTTSTFTLTAAQIEADVRAFAAEFPTPNVLRAIRFAETGQVSWTDLYDIARDALAKANAEVSS